MKYKVIEGSETALKLQSLFQEIEVIRGQMSQFCLSIGGTGKFSSMYLAGPISGIEMEFVPENWKDVSDKKKLFFAPKVKPKSNLTIIEGMKNFKKIDTSEIREIINFSVQSYADEYGFKFVSCPEIISDYSSFTVFIMEVNDHLEYKPNHDIVQISDEEYLEIQEQIREGLFF